MQAISDGPLLYLCQMDVLQNTFAVPHHHHLHRFYGQLQRHHSYFTSVLELKLELPVVIIMACMHAPLLCSYLKTSRHQLDKFLNQCYIVNHFLGLVSTNIDGL